MDPVFITDGLLRKSLSTVRSLGAKGIPAITADRTRFTPAAFSKYCSRSLTYPDPAEFPEEFYRWLLERLREIQNGVLFPMDDTTMEIVMAHREEVETFARLAVPPQNSYQLASDKYQTMRLAKEAGIPCPETVLPENIEQVEKLAQQLAYPVVIKPRKSSGSRGIRIVREREDLLREYQRISDAYPQPMIQEYIPIGQRYDVCLLFNKQNELRRSFVQREVRHFPLEIGPSTVQESVWMPELVEQAMLLMAKLEWTGVAEIEFMQDSRDETLKLMEINPRFWNSLHLAVQSGVDFPYLLYRLAIGDDVEPQHHYSVGQVSKNLLPGDLLHFLKNKRRFQMVPPIIGGNGNIQDDILSRQDPLPALGFFLASLRLMAERRTWGMLFKR